MAGFSARRLATYAYLGLAWAAALGCGPSMLSILVLPWVEDKVPAKFKLADPDKEVTVAVVAWFAHLEVRPEAMPADSELSERVVAQLRERCKANKEKVKFVPPAQARSWQNKVAVHGAWSPAEVGEKSKADLVVALEVSNFSIYQKSSYNQLFRGNVEIAVKVYDVRQPEGEQVVFEEAYRTEYPRSQPVDTGSTSESQFRSLFLNRVARDVAKLFTAYPFDQRVDME